jgi:hypothetical protein
MKARKGSFHGRFNIDISLEDVQQMFVERAHTNIFDELYRNDFKQNQMLVRRCVADALGKRPRQHSLSDDIGNRFSDVLKAIEGMYAAARIADSRDRSIGNYLEKRLNGSIKRVLAFSEVDLGIRWVPPQFQRAGAEELDRALVNDTLDWLRKEGCEAVVKPFEKGLRHLMESQKRPELRENVVAKMYQAMEALAKKVTGKDLDLPKNTGFIDALNA